MEHHVWWRVCRIHQKYTPYTRRLVDFATIDRLIEAATGLKPQLVLYAFGEVSKACTDVNADEVYDFLISKISPQILNSTVIAQSDHTDDGIDVDSNGS
jgi:hypothetical protein